MKPALSLLVGLLLSSCAIYQPPLVPLGASTAQVQSTIGLPKSKTRDGSVTTWNYGDGMVCVFRNGQLIATNFNPPSQQPSLSLGSLLPPVAINLNPVPYYSAPVYAAPVYAVPYYGGWGAPYYGGGWGNSWGGGWNRSYRGGACYPGGYYRGYRTWNRRY